MRTKSAIRLLASIHYSLVITRKLYLTYTTVHINIYTACILILVRSSCTREHHESYLWNVLRHAEEHECFCKLRRELYCICEEGDSGGVLDLCGFTIYHVLEEMSIV